MRGGHRKGFGGPQPKSGRPTLHTARHVIRLTAAQWAEFVALGGSAWLQGAMNLLLAERYAALVLLLIDGLIEKHGREWLPELAGKINERVNRG